MENILEYKCPCCGGAIVFDSNAQKMKCPSCDTEFDAETLKEYDKDLWDDENEGMDWSGKENSFEWKDDDSSVKSYICTSCGGEIIADENTAASSCPFCDSPVIMKENLSGTLKPDYVIPFKLDKEAAKNALRGYVGKKRLLPKVFKDENHIDEVKGIYVPFWLFNADASARVRYKATMVRSWREGNYECTETSHFSLIRGGKMGFDRIPVDGSSKMDDELMESVEPFDFSEAVDFQTAYLSGYLADKYDVSSDDSIERANARVKSSTEARLAMSVLGYTTSFPVASDIRLSNSSIKYALYPVWILNTSWGDKKYTFAVNGQTGKTVGDLPLDKGAFFKWFVILSLILGGVCFALISAVWMLL